MTATIAFFFGLPRLMTESVECSEFRIVPCAQQGKAQGATNVLLKVLSRFNSLLTVDSISWGVCDVARLAHAELFAFDEVKESQKGTFSLLFGTAVAERHGDSDPRCK